MRVAMGTDNTLSNLKCIYISTTHLKQYFNQSFNFTVMEQIKSSFSNSLRISRLPLIWLFI